MDLKKSRQILKSLADDNRLRIINLLNHGLLNVAELCQILRLKQSNISRHLTRLRLTGLVGDKRQGQFVYYYLIKPANNFNKELISCIVNGLKDSEIFKNDVVELKRIKRS
ncbi:MAG: metalloregulator ArsR/SmtB family transcription factor [Endomicrobiales bacterium]|nr:metalloregulator ArsR/SmtB family transcription factor [Endomicrobiales bacterium]